MKRLAGNIYRSSRRIQELLQDLLNISRGKVEQPEVCRLLQHAQGMNADLLVMGAYGQGRMMQFLGLGGATAKVITGNTMPLLLTH